MYYQEIENIFRENLASRHMEGIYLPKMFEGAVGSLIEGSHIVIVTGFVVKAAKAGETDGPPGALILAKTLEKMGKKVTLITDPVSGEILKAGIKELDIEASLIIVTNPMVEGLVETLLVKEKVSHLLAIERPSRAGDGHFYSMRGEAISDYVTNTDLLFHQAKDLGITTIGIGDGGNEVGMANIRDYVCKEIPLGDQICATTYVDYLLIGGVSNWVAYGLSAALSIVKQKLLMHDRHEEIRLLKKMVSAGAVDGMAQRPVLKVDGIDLEINLDVFDRIRQIAIKNIKR
jgi:hypothetical protein